MAGRRCAGSNLLFHGAVVMIVVVMMVGFENQGDQYIGNQTDHRNNDMGMPMILLGVGNLNGFPPDSKCI
jgi:hypothetical protein